MLMNTNKSGKCVKLQCIKCPSTFYDSYRKKGQRERKKTNKLQSSVSLYTIKSFIHYSTILIKM